MHNANKYVISKAEMYPDLGIPIQLYTNMVYSIPHLWLFYPVYTKSYVIMSKFRFNKIIYVLY